MPAKGYRCHPCLPKKLLDEFKADPIIVQRESTIFREDFEQFRVKALSHNTSCETEVARTVPPEPRGHPALDERVFEDLEKFHEGQNRTFLHLAAKDGDVPLAYECIRIGTAVDHKDADGVTALLLACRSLRATKYVQEQMKTMPVPKTGPLAARVPPALRTALSSDTLSGQLAQFQRIAALLVEQHADVNVAVNDETPLTVAAEAACWPLVELLLRHGAKPPRAGQRAYPVFLSAVHKSRFESLVRTVRPAHPRPARPCPCWSGALLTDCHAAAAQPYPPAYLCRCGSRKTHERCCARREFRMEEKWSAEDDWIMPVKVMRIPLPQDASFQAGVLKNHEIMTQLLQETSLDMSQLKQGVSEYWQQELGGLPPDMIDPAFLHAMKSVDFIPRPWTGHLSRVEAKKRCDEWNAAVDTYIESDVDDRVPFEIELEAKIGVNGGPLYKECEFSGCTNVEEPGATAAEKMKCCASCKLIVYCSQACQTADWQRHKAECKTKSHKEQQLRSQDMLELLVSTRTRMMAGASFKDAVGTTLQGLDIPLAFDLKDLDKLI